MNSRQQLTEIMRDAWSLYRRTVAQDPNAATRATFSAALSFAWERCPARYAARIRREWAAQGAAQQLNSCRRMVRKAADTWESKCGAFINWLHVELDDLAADTWIIMQERVDTLEAIQTARNRADRLPLPLGVLLHRASLEALKRRVRDIVKNDGDSLNESMGSAALDDMESAAAIQIALNSIKNPTQKAVLSLLVQGLTVREISAAMNKSKSTVQRIIDAIRAQITAQLAA
ncbi:ECF-type sigma factor [uncultured Dysosmobacter sp.]|uniref:ECF-type sigma factor n=1 Tax=uncultured Dysosmobacter sp. TaxID=2591384 RepID=UPI002613C192|nr:ECF-type sigma factor [uncultured Dysosmobacter sp.]